MTKNQSNWSNATNVSTVLVSKSEGQTYYVPPNFKVGGGLDTPAPTPLSSAGMGCALSAPVLCSKSIEYKALCKALVVLLQHN